MQRLSLALNPGHIQPDVLILPALPAQIHRARGTNKNMVKPHGQLVPVSFTHCCASTSGLSTSWSWRALEALTEVSDGIPDLGGGFPLRCFQRLSFPHIATQLCRSHDDWSTRGASIGVLSYYRQLPSSILRPRQIGTELSHDVLNPARVPL